jgi:DinB superfamily
MDKSTLISQLLRNKEKVVNSITKMTEEALFKSKNEKWTNAGHVEHLINSIKPLNLLFMFPKFVLTAWAGKPNRKSRSYEALVEKYWEQLNKRNPTVNRFGPKNKITTKKKLIAQFEKEYDNFANKIKSDWDEINLEKYLIPHPLLGKLTVKEMIMFTIYHTEHHQKALA